MSHFVVEGASWMAPGMQNTWLVLLPCDSPLVLCHGFCHFTMALACFFSKIDRPNCSILYLICVLQSGVLVVFSSPPSPACCVFLLPSSACLQVWWGLSLVGALIDLVYVLVWTRMFLLFSAFALTYKSYIHVQWEKKTTYDCAPGQSLANCPEDVTCCYRQRESVTLRLK